MYAKGSKKNTVMFRFTGGSKTGKVAVAGDFTDWQPKAMRKGMDGVFSLTLPVPPGRYEYKFVVDGDWVHDNEVTNVVKNMFGTFNSVLEVK